ncbi:50S ribosomal protein L9 [Candidatus Cyanaurora vandensis]|uniref:50S ribosomal protein L9 n=1 Tax=Candidatus Cyanaurora vandensis TaxID=2714958 RepID=UPI00257959E8|nr:50S ribosomal protein L9 [Candidatus Cyanaurora vandensis]
MNVKLVLKQDVEHLGRKGALVEVAPGYARNYLLPRGLAERATTGLVKLMEQRRVKEREAQAKLRQTSLDTARVLEGIPQYVIQKQVGETGQLFGSVTAQDIADAVQNIVGFSIDRRELAMPEEDIRNLGTYIVRLKLFTDIAADLTIEVIST